MDKIVNIYEIKYVYYANIFYDEFSDIYLVNESLSPGWRGKKEYKYWYFLV